MKILTLSLLVLAYGCSSIFALKTPVDVLLAQDRLAPSSNYYPPTDGPLPVKESQKLKEKKPKDEK